MSAIKCFRMACITAVFPSHFPQHVLHSLVRHLTPRASCSPLSVMPFDSFLHLSLLSPEVALVSAPPP